MAKPLAGKLSSKNQVVIPSELRLHLGLKSGDKLLFVPKDDFMIVMKAPKNHSKALRGILEGDPISLNEKVLKDRKNW